MMLVACSLLPAVSSAQADTAVARQVLEAEDRRFAAMVRADTLALEQVLARDLTYTHTTGEQDGKAELLHALAVGELRYESIAPEGRVVRVVGGIAVVVGRARMRAGAPGRIRAFRIRYLAVYRHADRRWQLVAWQATLLPQ